jgi:hypothetical protein
MIHFMECQARSSGVRERYGTAACRGALVQKARTVIGANRKAVLNVFVYQKATENECRGSIPLNY